MAFVLRQGDLPPSQAALPAEEQKLSDCSNRGWGCLLISDYISVPMSSPNKLSDFDHHHNTTVD